MVGDSQPKRVSTKSPTKISNIAQTIHLASSQPISSDLYNPSKEKSTCCNSDSNQWELWN